jgi:hypothetical protein
MVGTVGAKCEREESQAYIVEDIQIGVQRVSSGWDGAIVGNLDGIVERGQIDAVNGERHVGGVISAMRCGAEQMR